MTRRQRTQLVEVRADLILGAEFTLQGAIFLRLVALSALTNGHDLALICSSTR